MSDHCSGKIAVTCLVLAALCAGCSHDPDPMGPNPPSPPANLVTVNVTAVVTSVSDCFFSTCLGGQIHLGDTVLGSYSYDADAVDEDSLAGQAEYHMRTGLYGLSFVVGGWTFETAPSRFDVVMQLRDSPSASGGDAYSVASRVNLPVNSNARVDSISLELHDASGSALTSALLSSSPPRLTDWPGPNTVYLSGGDIVTYFHVEAEITDISGLP